MSADPEPSYSGEFDCTDCNEACELLAWTMIGMRDEPMPECSCCDACRARRDPALTQDQMGRVMVFGHP